MDRKYFEIYICNTPPDVLAQARTIARKKPAPNHLLNSDATPRPARPRKPPIPIILMVQRPPTINLPQPIFVRLGRLLRFPGTNSIHPIRNDQPRDPLDFSATLPLPRPLSEHTSTLRRSDINSGGNSRPLQTTRSSATGTPPTTFRASIHHPSSWWPVSGGRTRSSIVNVPLAQAKERNAASGAPSKDEDIVPEEYFDPPRRTLIHNHPQRHSLPLESIEATGLVSASSVVQLTFCKFYYRSSHSVLYGHGYIVFVILDFALALMF